MDDDVELEIEVSDLHATNAGEQDGAHAETSQLAPETSATATSRLSAGRLWQGTRLRRTLIIGGVIALAAAIVLGTLPNAGKTLRAALGIPTPSPTQPLPVGAGTFLIENTVPWGVLLSDGRPVTNLTLPQANPRPTVSAPTFVLDRGRHTIEYRAALFNTFRCVVSVPAAPDDTCPLAQSPHDLVPGLGAARLLDLRARPERLPLDQLTAL